MHVGTVLLAALATAAGLMLVAWLLYRATDKASWVDAFWAGNLAVLALGYAWLLPGDPARRTLVAIVGKIEAAVKAGKSLEEVKAMKPADGFGVNPSGFITADRFVEMVYGTFKQ